MADVFLQAPSADGVSRHEGTAREGASRQPVSRRFAFGSPPDRVRMGPLSLFALVIIVSLAVLSMLVFSTANASFVLSQRQADTVQVMYENERAAQEFVAALDEVLVPLRGDSGLNESPAGSLQLVADSLDDLCARARGKAGGKMQVTAEVQGDQVLATFVSNDEQALDIAISIGANGTMRVDSWKTSAVHSEGEQGGQLLTL